MRGQLIEVDMTHDATAYRLLEGSGLMLEHHGAELRLTAAAPLRLPAGEAGGDELPLAA